MSKGMQMMVAIVAMTVMEGAVQSPAYTRDVETQTGYVMALNLLEETEVFLSRPKIIQVNETKAKKELDAAVKEMGRAGVKDGRHVVWPRKAATPEDAAKEEDFLVRARVALDGEKELSGHAGMRARVIKDIQMAQELLAERHSVEKV
jgi:hypothetical protein